MELRNTTSDVLVIGGGPAGVCAAVAAARAGAKTTLIERHGFLGGMATAGMVNPIYGFGYFEPGRQLITGIAQEIVDQLAQIEGGTLGHTRREECAGCTLTSQNPPTDCPASGISSLLYFDPETLKLAMLRLVKQSGVSLLCYTSVQKTFTTEGRITGVSLATKRSPRTLDAKVVIDATGDGDIAAMAGAPFEFGDPQNGQVQPQSLMFRIAGVKLDTNRRCFEVNPSVNGVTRGLLFRLPREGEYIINSDSGLFGLNPLDPQDLTQAHATATESAFALTAWLRENIDGCQACYLVGTASTLGIRESRRILGDYVLTKDDVLGTKKFGDGIARCNFPLDIHVITDDPVAHNPLTPLPCGDYYEIPYRCLVPQKIEGLLTAGRCISGTHEAFASYRIMATCMQLGQAAGTAAAMSVQQQKMPREILGKDVRETLIQNGVIL